LKKRTRSGADFGFTPSFLGVRSVVRLLGIPFALLVVVWLPSLRAQQSDTASFKEDKENFAILSEIKDAGERAAFTAAYSAKEPAKRHALACAFLEAYPHSWLLAQVYDLAARSSIDLGAYERAIEEGRFSLRLMPENSVLLVLIANLEAQTGKFEDARRDASDALDYLDCFLRPPTVTEAQWRSLETELKASAWFAIGRSYTAQALGQLAPNRDLLTRALDALNRSVAWNAKDAEPFYIRALVEVKLGDDTPAASDLAFTAQHSADLKAPANAKLAQLYKKLGVASSVPGPSIDPKLRGDVAGSHPSPAIRAGYAGSLVCRSCHAAEYDRWRQTGMSRMLRAYDKENVIGDFRDADYREDGSVIRMGSDSRPYFDVQDATGHWQRFHVDYTIGSKWQQGYATRLNDGRLQVLPIEYNLLSKAWVNYWKIIDPPGSERAVITNFPRLSSATNYQENCAVCHTSQLTAASNGSDAIEHAAFRETGVDCEMCHGPSALHAAQMRRGRVAAKDFMQPPLDLRRISNREGVRVCGQCHRQSAVRRIGTQGEMNFATDTASFVQPSWNRPYDVFSRRAFYKDGRFRETTFIVEAFTRSACYRSGTAQCASCHSPHLENFAANPRSLKFSDSPDEMCLQCHAEFRNHLKEHTHHPADSEGSRCVACHMPKIVNALLFKARSHQIEIPRADLTVRFGQEESPNACLLCHSEKSAAWAGQELDHWAQAGTDQARLPGMTR
jgi:predicted CXXCH cytochrome family protein